jgi:Sec-independent protein translocase protein TatA
LQDAIAADERAIDLATRFGYTLPNAYKSLGGALKELVEQTRKKKKRAFYEDRLEALRKSAGKARAEMAQQQGSRQSVTSENVYG